jgi:hypothetical protein
MMPRFSFVGFNPKKAPSRDEVPTHVSVRGRECEVDEDGSIEAPMECEADLRAHGFELRRRPSVAVRPREAAPAEGELATSDKGEDQEGVGEGRGSPRRRR